jgi:hypothetical protein
LFHQRPRRSEDECVAVAGQVWDLTEVRNRAASAKHVAQIAEQDPVYVGVDESVESDLQADEVGRAAVDEEHAVLDALAVGL